MPKVSRSTLVRYGGAVLAVVVSLGVRSSLAPVLSDRQPLATFYLAAILTAFFGGLGPGLVAIVLGAAAGVYFFYGPRSLFAIRDPSGTIGLGLFLGNTLVVAFLADARTRARRLAVEGQEGLRREVAERRRIADALAESEARFRAFIDNSPAIHLIKDEAGRYTFGNAAWAAQFGRPSGELIGLDDFALWAPETARAFRESDRKAIESGRTVEALEQAEGRHWMSLKFPLDHRGRRYVGGIVLDVTEKVEATQALKRSEDLFRALADSMPQIVWAARPDGHIDYFNRRWFDYSGFTEAETFVPEGWAPLLHPDDLGPVRQSWAESVASGEPFEVEFRFRDGHRGGYRWHLGRALPVKDDAGAIVRWYGTCTDIDDRKRAEEAVEAANQAKDRFLAILSHELRTPLTPVLLAVSALIDDPGVAPAGGEFRATLDLVRRNVMLEARLIDDLLDVTRILQGKMTFHPATADVHELIRHALAICRAEVDDARVALEVEALAGDHHVMADPARLQQVFWNLIKNAAKFTPPGGHLAIRTRNEGPPGPARRLVVEFQDSGIGIAAEFLPRIFDPFAQEEASYRTRKYGGLGLGLAISRSLVEAHGGTLVALSEGTGRGATFRIDLATADARASNGPPAPPDDPTPPGLGLRILLVEDDPSTREVLSRLLRKLGHEVITADCVSAALSAAEGQEGWFQLILSDIGLPDGTGLDVVRKLKPLLHVPAIALTGFGTDEDIRQGLEAGFSAHLTKPIEPRVLEAAIRRVSARGA